MAKESEVNVQANNRKGERERSEWINERKESHKGGMTSECECECENGIV